MKGVKKVRVLHATETMRGGLQTYLEEVLSHDAKGIECFAGVVAPHCDLIGAEVSGANCYPFHRSGRNVASFFRFLVAMLRAIALFRPDIIHLHSSFAGFIGRIALLPWRLIGRCHVIYTPHGWSFLAARSARSRNVFVAAERVLARVSSAIVTVSRSEKGLAESNGIHHDKLQVIHNPRRPIALGDARRIPSTNGELRLLFVGRLDRAKGFDLLLQALAQLPRRDWSLDVIGDCVHDAGPDIPKEIQGKVRLHGWQSSAQLAGYYVAADCLVVPSRWEAFGLVALEAMQCGLAVYASNVGGLPELVDETVGALVDPTVEAWVEAIEGMHIAKLADLGETAATVAKKKFSSDASHADRMRLYQEVVGVSCK